MLSVISFLNNRQNEGRSYRSLPPKARVNLNDQLLRLENCGRDQLPTYGQGLCFLKEPLACRFRKDAELDILAVANKGGEIVIIDTEKSIVLKSFRTGSELFPFKPVFDIIWLPNENFLMTADKNTAKLFDMITCECVSTFGEEMNLTETFRTIDVCPVNSNIFATGTIDGCISLWDRRDMWCRKPYSVIKDAHPTNCSRTSQFPAWNASSGVTNIAFQDGNHFVSSGSGDGGLKVWDLRRTYLGDHEYSPWKTMEYCTERISDNGCSSLKFDSTRTRLYANLMDNSVRRFDCLSYTEDEEIYIGMKKTGMWIRMDLSYDDQYLLCGSQDGQAYIWNTSKPGSPLLALRDITSSEVRCVAWCPYSHTKLVTTSSYCILKIWRILKTHEDGTRHNRRYDFDRTATTEGLSTTPDIQVTSDSDGPSRGVKSSQRYLADLRSLRERYKRVKPRVSSQRPTSPQPCSSTESDRASSPSTERTPCHVTPSSPAESTQRGEKNSLSSEIQVTSDSDSDGPSRGAQVKRKVYEETSSFQHSSDYLNHGPSTSSVVSSLPSKKKKADKILENHRGPYSAFGNHVVERLRAMSPEMAMICQRVISEALLYGESNNLKIGSKVVNSVSTSNDPE